LGFSQNGIGLIKKENGMITSRIKPLVCNLLILTIILFACNFSTVQPISTPAPTDTLNPTATNTATPTNTPRPSPTPRPTKTPNLAATQKQEGFDTETQLYFDKGYLKTLDGSIKEVEDFSYDWAQLGWYNWIPLNEMVSDFYISAHFKWSSAYRNSDTSGCGILFAVQDNGDHYAVFLDRNKILFLNADTATSYSRPVGLTRGTSRVKFNNPADNPVEADFTVIVNDSYAYVLVDREMLGEYTLAKSKILDGDLGLSILSGTNKDYGTRCEMTNVHIFIPN
jgi:hypothetical protein